MNYKYLLFCSILLNTYVLGQLNVQYETAPPNSNKQETAKVFVLDNSSPDELLSIFHGIGIQYQASDAVNAIAKKGNKTVPALEQLLFSVDLKSSNIIPPDTGEVYEGFVPQLFLVIETLELINTDEAISVIIRTAKNHKSIYLKNYALQSVAKNMYEGIKSRELFSRIEVIELLIDNIDDETFIVNQRRPIREIASEGLIKWIGFNFNDPRFEEDYRSLKIVNPSITRKEFGKKWFKDNSSKLRWNKITAHFDTMN